MVIDATPQRNAIRNSWQTFPMRAPLPGAPPPATPTAGNPDPPAVLVFEGGGTTAAPVEPAREPAAPAPEPATDVGAAAVPAAPAPEAAPQTEPLDRSVAVATAGAALAAAAAASAALVAAL